MGIKRRNLISISSIVGIFASLLFVSPASADVPLPVEGSVTTTVPGTNTPITLTAGSPTPAMTFTAFGIGLSGVPYSTRFGSQIQVRPSYLTTWPVSGWSPKVGCPTSSGSETTLAACGISAVFVNGTDVTSNAKVFVEPTGSSISNTFIINAISGNFTNDIDALGTVRVELDAGAWILDNSADTTRGFSMQVRALNGDMQGKAFSYQRTVVFNANAGNGNPYTQSWTTNATKALTANLFTKSNYTFSGWNTREDGTGVSYLPGANYVFSTNQNLYAQWTSNSNPQPSPTPDSNSSGQMSLANTGSQFVLPASIGVLMVFLGGLLFFMKRRAK